MIITNQIHHLTIKFSRTDLQHIATRRPSHERPPLHKPCSLTHVVTTTCSKQHAKGHVPKPQNTRIVHELESQHGNGDPSHECCRILVSRFGSLSKFLSATAPEVRQPYSTTLATSGRGAVSDPRVSRICVSVASIS